MMKGKRKEQSAKVPKEKERRKKRIRNKLKSAPTHVLVLSSRYSITMSMYCWRYLCRSLLVCHGRLDGGTSQLVGENEKVRCNAVMLQRRMGGRRMRRP
jgi:hypothetical protein